MIRNFRHKLKRQFPSHRSGRTNFGRCVTLLALFWICGTAIALAQPDPGGPGAPPAVTVESIEALRKQSAESAELDADTKQKIDALCAQGLECLKLVVKLNGQAEQYKRETDDVQQRVEMLRRRLVELRDQKLRLPTELSLPELEQEVSRRDVALAELKAAQARAEAEPATRANRRREIRGLLLSAAQRIAEVQQQLDAAPPAEEPQPVVTARRYALQARRMYVAA